MLRLIGGCCLSLSVIFFAGFAFPANDKCCSLDLNYGPCSDCQEVSNGEDTVYIDVGERAGAKCVSASGSGLNCDMEERTCGTGSGFTIYEDQALVPGKCNKVVGVTGTVAWKADQCHSTGGVLPPTGDPAADDDGCPTSGGGGIE